MSAVFIQQHLADAIAGHVANGSVGQLDNI